MHDVVSLSSDTDDDAGLLIRPTNEVSPVAAAIDSDDDQPLEVLKGHMRAKTASITTSNTASDSKRVVQKAQVCRRTTVQQAAACTASQASNCFAQQAEAVTAKRPARGKENAAAAFGYDVSASVTAADVSAGFAEAAAPSAADDLDLDKWCLQPLQRRIRRRAGHTGTADAPAASGNAEGATAAAGGGTAPAAGTSSGMQQSQLDAQQQWQHAMQHSPPPAQQNHNQDASLQQQRAFAAKTEAACDQPVPVRKRQRQQQHANSSYDTDPADPDPSYEADHAEAVLQQDDDEADQELEFAAAAAGGRSRARAARGGSSRGRGAATGRGRMTAEERAALRAEEKARKEAEKVAAKLAKQAEKASLAADKAAAKAFKRFESFAARKQNGNFYEYESVLVMDQATSQSALGLAVSAELDRRKTMGWQVVPQLPLTARWPGCRCFCFKRRKMCEKDEHDMKTASTTQLHSFEEDTAPPYVQLVFEKADSFMTELQRDNLAGLKAAVLSAHPEHTLGVVVLGLKSHVQKLDNQSMRQGAATQWDWRRTQNQLLQLHLSTPGLHLRLLTKLDEAATHLINTTRVLGQQPYSVENQLEATGGTGPGVASKSAAAAMAAELGPTTCSFAVNTLGKMHGMGGNKAWAVAKQYPSFGALIAGFQKASNVPGSNPSLLLQDLMEPAGSGKAKPRRVGPVMSKRLHLLLTCEDPDAIVEGGDTDAE